MKEVIYETIIMTVFLTSITILSAMGDEMTADKRVVIGPETPVTIVLSLKPSETEKFAAEELSRYLQIMTGLKVKIKSESSVTKDEFVISIGKTKNGRKYLNQFDTSPVGPGKDSFVIDVKDDGIILVGGADRGMLYSVYELLEQQGCRWFFPGELGEVVPKKKMLLFPKGKQFFKPDFFQRELDINPSESIPLDEAIDWAVKNRLNRIFAMRDHFVKKYLPKEKWNAWTKRGGQIKWQWIAHNLGWMLPPEKWFESHPEYYALFKGERVPVGDKGRCGGNLCTTNPDVIKICAEFANDWFENNSDGNVVPIWPNDGAVRWCECDNCRKLGGKNFMSGEKGSMSARMVAFCNAVARKIKPEFRDRYILCPAYSNYLRPTLEPLEENIMVQYCLHGDYGHGVDKSVENKEEKGWLDTWAKKAPGRIGVWEYFLLGDFTKSEESVAMLPLVFRARDTIKYLKKIGVNWYFTQSSSRYWRHNILPFYVTARLIWDADQNFNKLLTDYCDKMFGPAGKTMKNYYQLIEESTAKSDWHPRMYGDVAAPSPKVFTSEVLEKCDGLLRQAESMSLSPIQKKRLALVRKTFEFVKSNVGAQSMLGIDPDSIWRLSRGKKYYIVNAEGKELSDVDLKALRNNAIDSGTYDDQFEKILFRAQKRKEPIVFLENERLKVGVLPGLGGRIIRLIDKKTGHNFMKENFGKDSLDAIGGFYFNYGGYEEYVGKSFGAPGWECAYQWKKTETRDAVDLEMSAEIGDFNLRRVISLSKNGNEDEVKISSVLTNRSRLEQVIKLRVHPTVTLGGKAEENVVYKLDKDNKLQSSTVNQEHDAKSLEIAGLWAVVNECGKIGLVNQFDSGEAYPYLCKTGADFFTLELFGKEKTLKPGESTKISHKYKVLDNPKKQIPRLFQPNLIHPLIDKVKYETGIVGQAISFDGNSTLRYKASRCLKANAGTIEMWVKPMENVKMIENGWLLSVGQNDPFWMFVHLDKGKLSFLFKNGVKPYRGPNEYYAMIDADIRNWTADQWQHLAIVWGNAGENKSLVQIYINGKLRNGKYNLSLGRRISSSVVLGIGKNTSASGKPGFKGGIDELRFSNYPRSATEILNSYKKGKAGIPLEIDEGTLAIYHFDGEPNGKIGVEGRISSSEIKKIVEKITEDI